MSALVSLFHCQFGISTQEANAPSQSTRLRSLLHKRKIFVCIFVRWPLPKRVASSRVERHPIDRENANFKRIWLNELIGAHFYITKRNDPLANRNQPQIQVVFDAYSIISFVIIIYAAAKQENVDQLYLLFWYRITVSTAMRLTLFLIIIFPCSSRESLMIANETGRIFGLDLYILSHFINTFTPFEILSEI